MDYKEVILIFKNWGICFEKIGKFDEFCLKYEKGSDIVDNNFEGNYKWKVWIKIYLVLFFYIRYLEDECKVNIIVVEVF